MNNKTYKQILRELKTQFASSQNKITDFNDGSVIMCIFEAVSRVIESLYIESREGFRENLRKIPISVFNFKKKEGTKSETNVKFTRNAAMLSPTIIPKGTRVASGDVSFETTVQASIASNETVSPNVPVRSVDIGLKTNVSANTITTLESILPAEVVAVTNEQKAKGGSDAETNADFFERFKVFYNGLQGSNSYGIKSAALNIPEIRSASVVEHFPPQETYNATLYVDDGTGGLTQELKDKVSSVVNGDGTEENHGKRAVGIRLRILPATAINITIAVTCNVYRIDSELAISEITDALHEEINNLGIGENVLITSIILRLRRFSWIKDVSNLTINGSAENIVINDNEIARFLSANVTTVAV